MRISESQIRRIIRQVINESAGGIPWQEQVFGDARGTWSVGDLFDYASNGYDLQEILISDWRRITSTPTSI